MMNDMTVDEALAWETEHAAFCHNQPRLVMRVLGAEVRRLRKVQAEFVQLSDSFIAMQNTLARIEAALSTYRGYTLADKIKEALRDQQT